MNNSCFQLEGGFFDRLAGGTVNADARRKALASLSRRSWQGTSLVTYRSTGKLLIVDRLQPDADGHRALSIAGDFAAGGFSCTVLLRGAAARTMPAASPNVTVMFGNLADLDGYLGRFSARLETSSPHATPAQPATSVHDSFDLVLDLDTPPFLQREVLPPGYYAPGADAELLQACLQEIAEATGEFSKPVYVQYQPQICTHGARGTGGCTRCLDRCPAEAIRSRGERIEVNTSLCQGCGTCTAACPTGALSYAYPSAQEWLLMVRDVLADYRAAGGTQPLLLIYGANGAGELLELADALPDYVVPVPVEEIGSAGMDAWLSALAYGAGAVALLLNDETPARVRTVLEEELAVARALLHSMDYGEDRLRFIMHPTVTTFTAPADALPAADFRPYEKQRTLRLALDHLYRHAPQPREVAELPPGAPFGEVRVDQNTCTLCMSCVAICPVKALHQDVQQLQLGFREASCVQCGLCRNVCPEQSITLVPRFLFDARQADRPRIINEDQPFRCISCGKPFISRRMFDKIAEKLAATGNWNVDKNVPPAWMQMCGDCRIRK